MRSRRIILGIVLVVVGIAWILDLAGYPIFPGGFGTWWPLVIVLLGIAQLFSWPWNWTGGVFLIVVGALLQLWRLGKLGGDWWMYVGAAAIVFAGLSMITSPWRHRHWRERWNRGDRWSAQPWQGRPRYHWRGGAGGGEGDEAVFSDHTRVFDGEF